MTLDKYGGRRGSDIVNGSPPVFSISVPGLEGVGKTSFWMLTCPRPIVGINFGDRDPTILLYKCSPERQKDIIIYEQQSSSPSGWTREEAKNALVALSEIAQEHLSDGKLRGGTFAIDSGSTFWTAAQEVYVAPEEEKAVAAAAAKGKEYRKTGGLIYGKANLIVSGILNWIKSQGAYLVITHTKAQDWDSQGPVPGKYHAQQNNRVPYLVEVVLDLTKECGTCGSPQDGCQAHVGRKHHGRFLKLATNTGLEGMRIENPTFDMVYKMYTGKDFPRTEALV